MKTLVQGLIVNHHQVQILDDFEVDVLVGLRWVGEIDEGVEVLVVGLLNGQRLDKDFKETTGVFLIVGQGSEL